MGKSEDKWGQNDPWPDEVIAQQKEEIEALRSENERLREKLHKSGLCECPSCTTCQALQPEMKVVNLESPSLAGIRVDLDPVDAPPKDGWDE